MAVKIKYAKRSHSKNQKNEAMQLIWSIIEEYIDLESDVNKGKEVQMIISGNVFSNDQKMILTENKNKTAEI